jgi:uncharacterized protein (DUF1015 family)
LAEIQPFRGILYRSKQTDLGRVLAPPYDVISPSYREELYERDPRNVVRVILNRLPGEAGYADAGETFRRWREDGTLEQDASPAVYVLEQSFTVEGRTLQRFGLYARFRAEDKERRIILPHEQTRAAAKEDRWHMLQSTRANFSPIFLMFPDPEDSFLALSFELAATPPHRTYTDDAGIGHRLWRVAEAAQIMKLQQLLGAVTCYIADGHHRHATALRYRDSVGPDGAWTCGYFTPIGAPGLVVLPYHRILSEGPSLDEAEKKLSARFHVSRQPDAPTAAAVVGRSSSAYAFALAEPGKGALVAEAEAAAGSLLPKDAAPSLRALDTYFLHQAVLTPLLGVPDTAVSYVHSQTEAEHALAAGSCRLAVLMRATPVRQIMDVAEAGESMPAKSTFFHPKLPSGLVIHPLVA